MKLLKRPVVAKKKRAKPLAEVQKSLLHQAIKNVSKTVKLVKGFLILKCSRRISELKEATKGDGVTVEEKMEKELKTLQSLKDIDSAQYGTIICNTKLSIGNKECTIDANQAMVDLVAQQNRVIQALKEAEEAIKLAIDKNNKLRAEEQSRDAKTKNKGLLAERKINTKERTTAVFLDSLEQDESSTPISKTKQKENDKIKIQKSLRNKQNRLKNKQSSSSSQQSDSKQRPRNNKRSEGGRGDSRESSHNKDIYLPVERRSGNNNGSSNSSFTSNNSNATSNGTINNKRKIDFNDKSSSKRPNAVKPNTDSHQTMTAMKTEKLEQCVTSGKDWKESGVHPSWAAKHLSKTAAPMVISATAAGQGKKITFD